MNIQNLLNQFLGAPNSITGSEKARQLPHTPTGSHKSFSSSGLIGGATAGGIAALLIGNKKARKFAGKAATVGGAALLGGLAFSAFQNWRQQSGESALSIPVSSGVPALPATRQGFEGTVARDTGFQITLIKSMIAAAHADGHIDAREQQRIFQALDHLQLDQQTKGLVLDLMRDPAGAAELARETQTLEQKSEVYLAACFAIDIDQPSSRQFLKDLEKALVLPEGLAQALAQQVNQLNDEAA